MTQYNVTGMSCAACVARVERAVNGVEGVTSCSVSLLTNSMGVEGTAAADEIISAVTKAGYGASVKGSSAQKGHSDTADFEEENIKETKTLKNRLWTSIGFLLVLMYFSMGHMMWGWPIPSWFHGNHVAMGLLQLLLTVIVMVINQKFFISGFKALWNRSPNMDSLVALGSSASFVWSTYVLFAMTKAQTIGDAAQVENLMMEFYFESAAMILTLITVGKMLESMSKGRTTDALKSLMKLAPKTAVLERNGKEITVQIEEVKTGDIFVVRPGENIPVDGIVVEGMSAVNESALTGESIPVDKSAGDSVSAGTINQSGFLRCRASRVGEDTALSQIIKMVSDAAATKAPIAKIADKVSGIFVPTVICIAMITTAVWLLIGRDFGFALARGISVLVISCPCALGLATPVAIMVGNGVGAKNGILFKTAASLEETGRISIVALDKTGTITEGKPEVTDIVPVGCSEEELLSLAYSLERSSEHPLAKAVLAECDRRGIHADAAAEFEALPGNGLRGIVNQIKVFGGNAAFIKSVSNVSENVADIAENLSEQGKTPLFFAADGVIKGIIAVADVIKPDSADAVKDMQSMGLRVVMLTGDNEKTAGAIGNLVGVDEVIAGVLPDGKEAVIRNLQNRGKVAMVGDGINDAPALTRADIGIAIGAGTDVAIDAADVVLMKSRLSDVPAAIRLSKSTLRNIHQNLFWAFFYNTIGIPLAAGVFIPLGLTLNPMFGAAAMSLSSFCVVSNALRLNLVKIHKGYEAENTVKADAADSAACECDVKTEAASAASKSSMIIEIEGMMCEHCEGYVTDALNAVEGIKVISASHADGIAVIEMSGDVTEDQIKYAVESEGYKFIKVRNESEKVSSARTLLIEGMMCEHCEGYVTDALNAISGVKVLEVSHEKGTAVIKADDEVTVDSLKAAVEGEGYVFKGVQE